MCACDLKLLCGFEIDKNGFEAFVILANESEVLQMFVYVDVYLCNYE